MEEELSNEVHNHYTAAKAPRCHPPVFLVEQQRVEHRNYS